MTESRRDSSTGTAGFMRSLAVKRTLARFVLVAEQAAPRALPLLATVLLFFSAAWFGFFRVAPGWLHAVALFGFTAAFVILLIPLLRLRIPGNTEADRMLEERNDLPHQAIRVQDDQPATSGAFGQALWQEHQTRMARMIGALEAGLPKPDIARSDSHGLRAIPVLIACVAFAYSYSNKAGLISDIFHPPQQSAAVPDVRIDAWVTPPAYTGRAPVFLTGRQDAQQPAVANQDALRIPQFSELTVRVTSGGEDTPVTYLENGAAQPLVIAVQAAKPAADAKPADTATADPAKPGSETHLMKITKDGTLAVGGEQWAFTVIPDSVPDIAFDGIPRATVNGALEIGFSAKDDYGIQDAWAEIVPLDKPAADARPLYPLPEYRLDLPKRNAREAKGLSSRNLSEHPLSGKRVRVTLVARDAAGQEGRSVPQDMILPARPFFEPLAGAVAEQRQVFALNANDLPRAIDLNDALMVRPDETIPNLTHFLLLQSARTRMALSRNDDMLRDAAGYLWEIALGIEDGDMALADKRLRDAQQKLSEALEKGASDEEITKLMQELRDAMKDYMEALAKQAAKNPQVAANPDQNNVLRQQDLEKMMNQIENLAKSGAKDQARQMLSEMQRMMNNLQAGRMQQQQQQGQENSEMRKQMDKLGQLMQQQQQLMDETFKYDQALRDRMQRGDPLDGQDQELFDQDMPRQPGQQPDENAQQPGPMDNMTAEELKQALKDMQAQQDQLGKQLGELQKGLEGMGIKPGKGFGEAGREMKGASGALGKGQGEQAVGSQGRALQALRDGAQDMMQQMQSQGQGPGQGQGIPQYGQNGRDPLGRRQQNAGPDFGDQVKVPDEIDTQRAREILDEIRRRLGTNASPETERRYLERLLDIR
ncbi:membrane protein [Pararhizobium polonicum]|uniref:Membrane protein n=1 Tax=Pararhizobium polonicum TaxID=1612624 RepID=A0A1C7P2J7_9HYPH|nr:TIGR02302 family protein [Pararhizobium polonicum]OBZ95459.1 membrane protein [Pararhizobium polonicum]